MELKIDPEFRDLIPPLSGDEYKGLEESILKEGVRDPLIVWNGILVDGHNRYQICQRHGLPYETREMHFEDRDDAKIWILRNQIWRRNLTVHMKIMCAEKADEIQSMKDEGLKQKSDGGKHGKKDYHNCDKHSDKKVDTLSEVAKIANTSRNTVARVNYVEEHGTDEVKQAARAGDMSTNEAYIATRKHVSEENEMKDFENHLNRRQEMKQLKEKTEGQVVDVNDLKRQNELILECGKEAANKVIKSVLYEYGEIAYLNDEKVSNIASYLASDTEAMKHFVRSLEDLKTAIDTLVSRVKGEA